MTIPSAPGIEFAGGSDIGAVREENQDTIRLPDPGAPPGRGLLYALADGMGGLAHGKLASALAVDALFEAFYGTKAPIPKSLGRGVETANSKVFGAAQGLGAARMGTTLTAANVHGDSLCIVHVGDSRAYLVRDGRPMLLTNDHTTVGDLVRMKLIGPDKVRTHAQRSMLNRAVGLGLFVRPDITRVKLRDEDRIVICSDGLWSAVEDRDLASMATASDDLDEVCSSLIGAAIEGDSDDNVSVIVVRVGRASSAQGASAARGADHLINGGLMKTLSALIRPASANH
jgi:serine/threonine protein phosphatase PrpC